MKKISRRKFITGIIFAIFAIFISRMIFFTKNTVKIRRAIRPKAFPGKIKADENFKSTGEKLAG